MGPNLHLAAAPRLRIYPSWVRLLDRSSSRTQPRTRFPMNPQRRNSEEAQPTNLQGSLPATRGCLRLYCSTFDGWTPVLSTPRPLSAEPFTRCLQIAELMGIPAVSESSNFVFSPLSLVAALSLTASGARGETLTELLSFLGSPNLDQLHSASVHLAQAVRAGDRELILSFVNGAWVDRSMAVNPSFVAVAASVYGAAIEPVDFIRQFGHVRLWRSLVKQRAEVKSVFRALPGAIQKIPYMEDIVLRGHSIECRINAEDPFKGFRPGPGEEECDHYLLELIIYYDFKLPTCDEECVIVIYWS